LISQEEKALKLYQTFSRKWTNNEFVKFYKILDETGNRRAIEILHNNGSIENPAVPVRKLNLIVGLS